MPPADGQDGQIHFQRLFTQEKFHLIPAGGGFAAVGQGFFAVIFWAHIRAAGEQQPVHPAKRFLHLGFVIGQGQQYGQAPSPDHSMQIILIDD